MGLLISRLLCCTKDPPVGDPPGAPHLGPTPTPPLHRPLTPLHVVVRSPSPVSPARRIFDPGKVEVVREVGRGRFGRVDMVVSRRSRRVYAVKRVWPREARMLRRVAGCRGVVDVHGFSDGGQVVWMECTPMDLFTYLRTFHANEPVPPEDAGCIGRQVAKALQCVHGEGVVHGDLKPENVLVRADRTLCLADFGAAHDTGAVVHQLFGTFRYMAPELRDEARHPTMQCTEALDVWSLGVLMLDLLVIQHRTPNNRPADVDYELARVWHVELHDLLTKMLQPDPARRVSLEAALLHPALLAGVPSLAHDPVLPHFR